MEDKITGMAREEVGGIQSVDRGNSTNRAVCGNAMRGTTCISVKIRRETAEGGESQAIKWKVERGENTEHKKHGNTKRPSARKIHQHSKLQEEEEEESEEENEAEVEEDETV